MRVPGRGRLFHPLGGLDLVALPAPAMHVKQREIVLGRRVAGLRGALEQVACTGEVFSHAPAFRREDP